MKPIQTFMVVTQILGVAYTCTVKLLSYIIYVAGGVYKLCCYVSPKCNAAIVNAGQEFQPVSTQAGVHSCLAYGIMSECHEYFPKSLRPLRCS